MAITLDYYLGELENVYGRVCSCGVFWFLMFWIFWCLSCCHANVSPWRGPGGRGPPVRPLPAWPRRLFPRRGAGEAVITGIYWWLIMNLHRAGTTLYFMSGPEAPYYFAINFIPYRTMSRRQRHLSFWHLSDSVAQIKHDSLIPKSVLKILCFSQTAYYNSV